MTTAQPAPPLLRADRGFQLFLASRAVAAAGSGISAVALPLLVFQLSGSPLLTSLVAALQVAPYLVFGLLAGVVADRFARRALMLLAQAVSAAALGSVPVAAALEALHVGHVIAVAATVATCFVWFDAAAFGALPALVGKHRLAAANSAVWTVTTLVGVAGPAAGGLVVSVVGPAAALGWDAVTYVVAGLLIALIGRALGPVPEGDTAAAPRGLRADVAEGLGFVFGHSLIRPLTLVGLGNSLTGGAVTALLVVLAVDALQLSEDGRWVGVLLSAVAIGGLLAALALPRLSRRFPVGRITLTGLVVATLGAGLVPAAPSPWWLLPPLLTWSFASTLVILNGITARQRLTPDHLQGRVNTTARMIAWGGMPLGALAAGALAEVTEVRAALLVAAGAVGLSAVLGWRPLLRAGRDQPDDA